MKIIDEELVKQLQKVELRIREIKKSDCRYRKTQVGIKRLRDTQRAPITSECFRNIEFHPSYNSLKNR